jgi:thiol-disulfide isomerase/thioredoxin
MLVAPKSTLEAVALGRHGGLGIGLGDLLLVLALQIVVTQLPRLVAAILLFCEARIGAGISLLLTTATDVLLLPLIAVVAATVLMSWLTRGHSLRVRNLDLAALCVLPTIVLQTAAALVFIVAKVWPGRASSIVVTAACALWFFILVAVATLLVRADGELAPAFERHPPQSFGAGLGVGAVFIALLSLNTVQVGRNWEQLRPVSIGRSAPLFTLEMSRRSAARESERISLAAQRGKVVLISFWAPWCTACLHEMPFLVQLQKELGERGFRTLAINIDGSRQKTATISESVGDALTFLTDDGTVGPRYGVSRLPHLVVVGREGDVRFQLSGEDSPRVLRQRVLEVLEH